MKTFLASLAMLCAYASFARDLDKTPDSPPSRRPETPASAQTAQTESSTANADPVPRGVQYVSAPNIRADLLVLSVSEKILLPLLPDLRTPEKVQAAQAKLLEMAQGGKVKIRDWVET